MSTCYIAPHKDNHAKKKSSKPPRNMISPTVDFFFQLYDLN